MCLLINRDCAAMQWTVASSTPSGFDLHPTLRSCCAGPQTRLPARAQSFIRPTAAGGCWVIMAGAALGVILLLLARPAARAGYSGLGWTQGGLAGWQAAPRAALVRQPDIDLHVRPVSLSYCIAHLYKMCAQPAMLQVQVQHRRLANSACAYCMHTSRFRLAFAAPQAHGGITA